MSLWSDFSSDFHYPKLEENKIVDTLIIGGGMSGIECMYWLQDTDVCLVEARTIGCGVSQNTTAKINYLQDTLFDLWKNETEEKAIFYLASQIYGMKQMIDVIEREQIDCDLESVTSFLVTRDKAYIPYLQRFKDFLSQRGISVTEDISSIVEPFLYGIGVSDTFVFHPLKYLYGLAQKISAPIYENTRIIKIVKGEQCYFCHTDYGVCIRARHVVVACHYPFFLFPFLLPLKSNVEKSYLVAVPVKQYLKYTYITVEKPTLSSRFYQDGEDIYQICLGRSHDISKQQNDEKNLEGVLEDFQKNREDVEFFWSNVDIKTKDHFAYIGEIDQNLFLSTGYQTWGMIGSMLGACIIRDQLNHTENEYAFLFSPKRWNFQSLEQLGSSLGNNTFAYVKSMYFPKSWYSKDLQFSFLSGKLIATYKDTDGEHKVVPICPHMRCGLVFNEVEKTWDCPCHSSRFDKDGNVLKGPSKYSIHVDPALFGKK